MTGEKALERLTVFANGLDSGGFEHQAEWVRGFRSELRDLLRAEEVIEVA